MIIAGLEPVIALRSDHGARISADRLRLLEAIADSGSISAAARSLGITYKAAWDAVAAINNLAERPIVVGHVGGRAGGGASLTAEGRRFLDTVRHLQAELQRLALAAGETMGGTLGQPHVEWRLAMKTSARNLLRCRVSEVKVGPVNAEVVLTLADGVHLVAIITQKSATNLELAPGREAFALIKSSFVLLAAEGDVGRTSARNVIPGTVVGREDGIVNSEIVLDIGGGKTIAAIITRESADTLAFKLGDRACALIKASHIILAVE